MIGFLRSVSVESVERRPSPGIVQRLVELLDVPLGVREIFLRVARAALTLDRLLAAATTEGPSSVSAFLPRDDPQSSSAG